MRRVHRASAKKAVCAHAGFASLAQRRLQRGRERGFSSEQIAPAQFDAVAMSLLRELERVGGDHQRVAFSVNEKFTANGLVEFGHAHSPRVDALRSFIRLQFIVVSTKALVYTKRLQRSSKACAMLPQGLMQRTRQLQTKSMRHDRCNMATITAKKDFAHDTHVSRSGNSSDDSAAHSRTAVAADTRNTGGAGTTT